jgi:7-cyano-7-deazaguanine synthase
MEDSSKPLAIAVVSGGMDSVTLVYELLNQGYDVKMLSFDYGQRHRKELNSASYFSGLLNLDHRVVDLKGLTNLLAGSSLTSLDVTVPDGHYTAESMKMTVVPNRNAIMLAIAWGWLVSSRAECVATAVHAGDHAIYPDCRADFIFQLQEAFYTGTMGFRAGGEWINTPYLNKTKADICREGIALGVPYEMTWSCYKGGALHCGQCGTCTERAEAFKLVGVTDPTTYAEEPRYA